MEIWRDVKDFEGYYQVSNLGRARSLDRNISKKDGTKQICRGRILKLKLDNRGKGYYIVNLKKQSINKHMKVHRLVAIAFIVNFKNKPFVNHINGITKDNRVSNLEWCTAKENSMHALKNGIHNPKISKKARESTINKCSKETLCVETGVIYKSAYEAAIWLNEEKFKGTKKIATVSAKIRSCRNEKSNTKTAYGFQWKFNK